MKTCQKCGLTKPKTEFWKQSRNVDGLYGTCKDCAREYDLKIKNTELSKSRKRKYYVSTQESILEKKKVYYKDNKDIIAKKAKVYREANKELIKHKQKWYYAKNKEAIRTYLKAYRSKEDYKLQAKHYAHSRRAKILSTCDNTINKDALQELLEVQQHKCFYCAVELVNGATELDHYIPISKGGDHSIGNVVFSCRQCNNLKRAKIPNVPLTFPIKTERVNYTGFLIFKQSKEDRMSCKSKSPKPKK